ncbi:hypothetical protein V6N13_016731 [Hibiscus sabdariffa]
MEVDELKNHILAISELSTKTYEMVLATCKKKKSSKKKSTVSFAALGDELEDEELLSGSTDPSKLTSISFFLDHVDDCTASNSKAEGPSSILPVGGDNPKIVGL